MEHYRIYTAGMLDGVLTGAGQLLVGGQVVTWVGGGSGKWSVASNWDPAVVPGEGSFVCFTNATYTEQEDVDIGAKGLAISTTGGDSTISNNFTGAGGLVKYGNKNLILYGCSTYAGPTQVHDGYFYVQREDAILPTRPVTIFSESGATPRFGPGQDHHARRLGSRLLDGFRVRRQRVDLQKLWRVAVPSQERAC